MLYPPCYPIPAQGSLVVTAIHGCVRDLQSTSVALQQGKGPFRWEAHQILGVTSKKVRSEKSFKTCDAHTDRYWAEVSTGGIHNSSINPRLMLNCQFLVENKQPIRIVLEFQMALEGSRCQAGAADITLHSMTFRSGVNWSLLLRVVHRFRVGYSYVPQDAHHDFCLVRVCPEVNAFKEGNEYIHGALQPNRVSRSNQPIVYKKSHYLPACLRKYPASNFFVDHLTKRLSYQCINTNIKH
jgi:hypothetical protein